MQVSFFGNAGNANESLPEGNKIFVNANSDKDDWTRPEALGRKERAFKTLYKAWQATTQKDIICVLSDVQVTTPLPSKNGHIYISENSTVTVATDLFLGGNNEYTQHVHGTGLTSKLIANDGVVINRKTGWGTAKYCTFSNMHIEARRIIDSGNGRPFLYCKNCKIIADANIGNWGGNFHVDQCRIKGSWTTRIENGGRGNYVLVKDTYFDGSLTASGARKNIGKVEVYNSIFSGSINTIASQVTKHNVLENEPFIL